MRSGVEVDAGSAENLRLLPHAFEPNVSMVMPRFGLQIRKRMFGMP